MGVRDRLWARALLVSQNILEPLAVPATGGVLTAVAVFMLVVQSMLVGMPLGRVEADDLPLNLVQPAELESLPPFPVPGVTRTEGQPDSGPLLIEATLNARAKFSITRFYPARMMSRYSDSLIKYFYFPDSALSWVSDVPWAAAASCLASAKFACAVRSPRSASQVLPRNS